jgi:hypothetical protein
MNELSVYSLFHLISELLSPHYHIVPLNTGTLTILHACPIHHSSFPTHACCPRPRPSHGDVMNYHS